jgi:hypothetical protein
MRRSTVLNLSSQLVFPGTGDVNWGGKKIPVLLIHFLSDNKSFRVFLFLFKLFDLVTSGWLVGLLFLAVNDAEVVNDIAVINVADVVVVYVLVVYFVVLNNVLVKVALVVNDGVVVILVVDDVAVVVVL